MGLVAEVAMLAATAAPGGAIATTETAGLVMAGPVAVVIAIATVVTAVSAPGVGRIRVVALVARVSGRATVVDSALQVEGIGTVRIARFPIPRIRTGRHAVGTAPPRVTKVGTAVRGPSNPSFLRT